MIIVVFWKEVISTIFLLTCPTAEYVDFFFTMFSHGRFHWRVLWMSFFMNSFSCIRSFGSLATWFCIKALTVVSAITILNSRVNSFVNVATWWRRKACIAILPSFGFHSVWIFSRIQQAGDWLKHLSQYLHRWGFTSIWIRSCILRLDDVLKN